MGCDIHAYVEKKVYAHDDKEKKNGIWISADKWTVNPAALLYPEDNVSRLEIIYTDSIIHRRDYLLFSILADVRNYDNKFTPISKPKGLPLDVSSDVKEENDRWGVDGHSHSYLTLKELEVYPHWTDEIEDMSHEKNESEALEKYGDKTLYISPDAFFGGVKVSHLSDIKDCIPDYGPIFKKLNEFVKGRNANLFADVVESTDDVRIVFWFDN